MKQRPMMGSLSPLLSVVLAVAFSLVPLAAAAAEECAGSGTCADDNFPEGWEGYTYVDIRDHFRCWERSGDNYKSLPSVEDWQFLRDKFNEIVDKNKQWDDPVPPTLGYSFEPGMPPPYHAKVSPGKGRGLFASRDIKKGELVHDGTHSDVAFPNALAWRRFVFSLPRDFACDCTDWHWMQRSREDGPFYLFAGINISSLMNSGGDEYGTKTTTNALPNSPISHKFYATKDIKKGEEILSDYYFYPTKWKKVGV